MCAGRIAIQDLKQEDLNGNDRIEPGLIPRHIRITTSLANRRRGELVRPISLELIDN